MPTIAAMTANSKIKNHNNQSLKKLKNDSEYWLGAIRELISQRSCYHRIAKIVILRKLRYHMEDWENELDDFLETYKTQLDKTPQTEETEETKRARKFTKEIVQPTFDKLKHIFNKHGRQAFVVSSDFSRRLEVWYKGTREICYTLMINGNRIFCKYKAISENDGSLRGNRGADPTIDNITQAHIGKHFVDIYKRDMRQNPRR